MSSKETKKEQAIALRRKGETYSEILKVVPVAKSTLSLWFRGVGLSKPQKQLITQKRIDAQKRGAAARKNQRISKTKDIVEKAKADIGKVSRRDLQLVGTALYWAEGSKAKTKRPSQGLDFGNSDPKMIRLYLRWLLDIVQVSKDRINLSLYIHETAKCRVLEVKKRWSLVTGFSEDAISYTYFKKHNPKTNRKNTNENYLGLLRIKVKRSTDLNRKIMGWVDGIVEDIT